MDQTFDLISVACLWSNVLDFFFFFYIVLGKLVTMLRRPNKRKENWQCGRKGYETVSSTEEGRGFMMYNFRIPLALWRCLSTYHFYNPMFGGYGVFQWPAAAAKLLQSCPTLCDPIGGSPPVSAVPGILQPRTLEWVAISFSISVTLSQVNKE